MSLSFDIIFVLKFFRRQSYILPLVKRLSSDLRIGVFALDLNERELSKHHKTNDVFLQLCKQLGATLIKSENVSSRVCIVPHEPYSVGEKQRLKSEIESETYLAHLPLAWAGLHNDFVELFDFSELFVPDLSLANFLIEKRSKVTLYEKYKITEVGLPYNSENVFSDFSCDYLIVFPTLFSFPHQKDKVSFLDNVFKLIEKLPADSVIYYKLHNSNDRNMFCRQINNYDNLNISQLSQVIELKRKESITSQGSINIEETEGLISALFIKLTKMIDQIKVPKEYSWLSLELFLPGVRKGVIGGLSNTIWSTLFNQIPFYNCVKIENQNRYDEDTLYQKDPRSFLDLNLQHFYVPFWEENLDFEETLFDQISTSCRDADFFKEVLKYVKFEACVDIGNASLK